ncbi:hypothetical protein [Paenibacillus castaneae]|uniref:hypothetical protein n=1 Tax=Paenibacillus castaneae TaxID=474957 RepID=UPI001ABA0C99|nr:hypothetical protein [Paenibacillus castaneae]
MDNQERSESLDQVVIWGIFVSEDVRRFPNFFPIAFFETREKAIEVIQGLPKDMNYDLLELPLNHNFAYFHKKNGKLVGMDGIYHEHFHFKGEHESDN